MVLSRSVFALGAALALSQGQLAHAAANADSCLSEAEVGGLVGYALPYVIDGAMKACKPHLSPTGFFATRGSAFAGQYAARKDVNWPVAKNAFLKLLVAQLQHQDPTNTQDPAAMIQQFTGFSTVEQIQALGTQVDLGTAGGIPVAQHRLLHQVSGGNGQQLHSAGLVAQRQQQ